MKKSIFASIILCVLCLTVIASAPAIDTGKERPGITALSYVNGDFDHSSVDHFAFAKADFTPLFHIEYFPANLGRYSFVSKASPETDSSFYTEPAQFY